MSNNKLRRRDLKDPKNLKLLFKDIRNHLAGMATGITRDEILAQEIINILFCKIYDEVHTTPDQNVTFIASSDEKPIEVKKRISSIFEKVKKEYEQIFDRETKLNLDQASIKYVTLKLQKYQIRSTDRDAIGDAFEVFIGPALRGGEGQFFTPRNVMKMMIDILDPLENQLVIDPACGSGGFLVATLDHVWKKIDNKSGERGWNASTQNAKKKDFAANCVFGIEKDSFLAKIAKAYIAVAGDGRNGIFCENSLKPPLEWDKETQKRIQLEMFDIAVTNPPHGSRIVVEGEKILEQYDLAKKWKKEKQNSRWIKLDVPRKKQPPQVLFIERCLQLIKQNGKIGIILPEGFFGNTNDGYIVEFIMRNAKILGIVSMPEELFQPHTHNKTCILFLEKTVPPDDYPIFMGIAKWCGHDSRGNRVPYDDLHEIAIRYQEMMKPMNENVLYRKYDRKGFVKKLSEIKNNILVPKYYDPELESELNKLKNSHELLLVAELVKKKVILVTRGVEVSKLAYGSGNIPFIRTSDIANWELKNDPKHGISEEIYSNYKDNKKVKENDILLVKDGSYLVGTTGIITKYDTKILFQSHIYRLRVKKPDQLSPFLLLAILNSPIVKKQIRAIQFSQGIIDTIGNRILELILPIPKDSGVRTEIIEKTREIVSKRAELRHQAREVSVQVQGKESLSPEDRILADLI